MAPQRHPQVTWIPLIWGVLCGAAASGHFEWTFDNCMKSLLCMVMSGPLLTGYTQVGAAPGPPPARAATWRPLT